MWNSETACHPVLIRVAMTSFVSERHIPELNAVRLHPGTSHFWYWTFSMITQTMLNQ